MVLIIIKNRKNAANNILWEKNRYPITLTGSLLILTDIIFIVFYALHTPFHTSQWTIAFIVLVMLYNISIFIPIMVMKISFIGISNNGIHLRYRKKVEVVTWGEIAKIDKVKFNGGKRWEIVLKSGESKIINFVDRRIIKKIRNEFEKYTQNGYMSHLKKLHDRTTNRQDLKDIKWLKNSSRGKLFRIFLTAMGTIFFWAPFWIVFLLGKGNIVTYVVFLVIVFVYILIAYRSYLAFTNAPAYIGISTKCLHLKYLRFRRLKEEKLVSWGDIRKFTRKKRLSFEVLAITKVGSVKEDKCGMIDPKIIDKIYLRYDLLKSSSPKHSA